MANIQKFLQNPHIPEFNHFIRREQAMKLRLDIDKLKLEVILDSRERQSFKKEVLIEGKYALVITYDGIGGYVLSFDESENGSLIVKQIQGAKSRVSYKVSTSLDAVGFYLDFFKKNIIGKIDDVNVVDNPTGLENPGNFFGKDPFLRYTIFRNQLSTLLSN